MMLVVQRSQISCGETNYRRKRNPEQKGVFLSFSNQQVNVGWFHQKCPFLTKKQRKQDILLLCHPPPPPLKKARVRKRQNNYDLQIECTKYQTHWLTAWLHLKVVLSFVIHFFSHNTAAHVAILYDLSQQILFMPYIYCHYQWIIGPCSCIGYCLLRFFWYFLDYYLVQTLLFALILCTLNYAKHIELACVWNLKLNLPRTSDRL